MAQLRSPASFDSSREPHLVSLKVLRLSRPSLSVQQPLPSSSDPLLSSSSYAYPLSNTYNDNFILSPLLTLPPAFGYVYVGETFSCTLCANNEILPNSSTGKSINAVRMEAEMKTPSSTTPIKLSLSPELLPSDIEKVQDDSEIKGYDLAPGQSLQKLVQFELTEEGSHVLAVSVTYSEITSTSGRVRTFRKLYQFACKNSLVVRSKTSPLPSVDLKCWALEAQLENRGEDTIVLETVELNNRKGFKVKSLNWDANPQEKIMGSPKLMPGDVQQICFYVEENKEQDSNDGKLIFGTLSVRWRGAMGNKGHLSTDPLGTRGN